MHCIDVLPAFEPAVAQDSAFMRDETNITPSDLDRNPMPTGVLLTASTGAAVLLVSVAVLPVHMRCLLIKHQLKGCGGTSIDLNNGSTRHTDSAPT
jgi:hypothetical protein